ncbi:MAG: gfo/Idh/MocA family oxidoreductase [Propionibacteriales bacterium]|nr:gfo/Idh/MocA family oxidoreductase [Propionibacteriales bacterium]
MTDGRSTDGVSRRTVLAGTAATAAATWGLSGPAPAAAATPAETLAPGRTMAGVPFEVMSPARIAIIGLGMRGGGMIDNFLGIPGARVTALCDIRPDYAARAAAKVVAEGQPAPAVYTDGDYAFEKMLERDDIDFVYTPTPWEWHTEMALAAMKAGKHVGVETPAGLTMKDLWSLVKTSEETRRHCLLLENCCYGKNEMRVLRMAHDGKFGELLHGAGAYLHDLRNLMFRDDGYESEWRRPWHTLLNGDLYPTHGLGPVASYMDINRGDRLTRITSMGTPVLGLEQYREANEEPGDSSWEEEYVKGDLTVSLVQTAKGRLIRLEHDVSNPRPYSRRNHLGGTAGVFEDYPARIYLEPDHSNDQWHDFDDYTDFDHWLWKENPNPGGGHGGMDYLMLWRLVQTMNLGLPPDMDVYDAASWSCPVPLSVDSIKQKSKGIEIPDFTRGHWEEPRAGVDSEKPA